MLHLKRNILINILISASLPVLIAVFFFINEHIDTKEKLATNHYNLALESSASNLQNYISRQVNSVITLSETPTVKSMDWSAIKPYLKSELERNKGSYHNFVLSLSENNNGYFYSLNHGNPSLGGLVSIDDNSPAAEAVSLKNKAFWQSFILDNKKRKSFLISYPENFYMEQNDLLVLSASIMNKYGEAEGVLSGLIDADKFKAEMNNALAPIYSMGHDVKITVADAKGLVLYNNGKPTNRELLYSVNPYFDKLLPQLFEDRHGLLRHDNNLIFFRKLAIANIVIIATIPEAEIILSFTELAASFITPILLVLLSSVLISLLINRRIEKKLNNLAESVESVASGQDANEFSNIEKEPALTALVSACKKITEKAKESITLSSVVSQGIYGIEYWLDASGQIKFISSSCYELTGYKAEEFKNRPELIDALVVEGDKEKWLVQKHGSNSDSLPTRLRIKTRYGNIIWVESIVRPVVTEKGNHDGIRGSLRDIDRLVNAENMFNENEQLFRKVFVKNTAVMMLIDPISGTIYDVNKAAETFYQSSRDTLISQSIMSFIHGRDKNMASSLERLLGNDVVTQALPDGRLKETEIHSTLLKLKDQVQLFLIIYDITNKVELQKKISESEQLFRTLSEKVPVAILVFSDKIHYANPMACEISGYQQLELESGNLWEHVAPEQQNLVKNSYFSAMEVKGTTKKLQDIRLNSKNGKVKNVFMTISSIIYEGKPAGLATIIDISEIKEAQYQLERKIAVEVEKHRQQEIMLMSQSRLASMGEMLGAIAHQWRQPLNTIGLYVQDLEDAFEHQEATPEYVRETVQNTMLQISMLSKTIDNFTSFYRPTDNSMIFCTYAAVSDSIQMFSGRLISENVKISLTAYDEKNRLQQKLDRAEESKFLVEGFLSDFKQVMLTVLKNSVDAIEEKRITLGNVEGAITVEITKTDKNITVKVSDNGCGISDLHAKKAFDPYFSTKEQGKGTGLGLYMSKTIIEKNMKGLLELFGTAEGVIVVITLPKAA
jgi:PAS domain S-box-containing protein